ncbi:MAG: hypothetical protein ACR2JB_11125 [Bryobacteraceae bacterium]
MKVSGEKAFPSFAADAVLALTSMEHEAPAMREHRFRHRWDERGAAS